MSRQLRPQPKATIAVTCTAAAICGLIGFLSPSPAHAYELTAGASTTWGEMDDTSGSRGSSIKKTWNCSEGIQAVAVWAGGKIDDLSFKCNGEWFKTGTNGENGTNYGTDGADHVWECPSDEKVHGFRASYGSGEVTAVGVYCTTTYIEDDDYAYTLGSNNDNWGSDWCVDGEHVTNVSTRFTNNYLKNKDLRGLSFTCGVLE